MAIILRPETERLLAVRLTDGGYASADELVRAALEALSEREAYGLDEETLDAIDQAEEQLERGEYVEWEAAREELRRMFEGQ